MSGGLHHPISWFRWIVANSRRLVVLLVGMAILGAGLAMLVLPGPGILVIIAGLAVLATEFAVAERMLDRTRNKAAEATQTLTATRTGQAIFVVSAASLIMGGGVTVALVEGYRLIGVATIVAGLCALSVLVPSVREWINRPPSRASGTTLDGPCPDPGDA